MLFSSMAYANAFTVADCEAQAKLMKTALQGMQDGWSLQKITEFYSKNLESIGDAPSRAPLIAKSIFVEKLKKMPPDVFEKKFVASCTATLRKQHLIDSDAASEANIVQAYTAQETTDNSSSMNNYRKVMDGCRKAALVMKVQAEYRDSGMTQSQMAAVLEKMSSVPPGSQREAAEWFFVQAKNMSPEKIEHEMFLKCKKDTDKTFSELTIKPTKQNFETYSQEDINYEYAFLQQFKNTAATLTSTAHSDYASCSIQASLLENVAMLRDGGSPESISLEMLNRFQQFSKLDKQQFVDWVYQNMYSSPAVIKHVYYIACINNQPLP